MTATPAAPRLMAISDAAALDGATFPNWLATIQEAGVDTVQIRAKTLDDITLFDRLRAARGCLDPSIRVLSNGRIDLCLAAGCDGVHLTSTSLSPQTLRPLIECPSGRNRLDSFLVGRSTHSLAEVDRALAEGSSYVLFGPIFDTPSKRAFGSPLGLDLLRSAVRRGLPIVAIGGIDADRVEDVFAVGATGVAAIGAFSSPAAARRLGDGVRSTLARRRR